VLPRRIGEERALTETDGLRAEIEKTARDMERTYNEALVKIKELKDTMNTLEQKISRDDGSEKSSLRMALSSASEKMNRLSDYLCLTSKKAWQTLVKLESRCRASRLDPPLLDEVRALCVKTEKMAADLLCYSLGR